ncbi:Sec-independent protein translocase subunit TatA [Corynebacterium sp. HMSC078H07]|uniref:Sec-independent protein translocase subunit TatA n=1 Tax=Corynebacterium sp. HMSC078H07 TaxID=1739379 RepID=UPI0008A1DA07|nr:Sec-independent protein translocase subunit TatA [Corynebacterium sp. HMSC078H07]OFR68402.1 prohead protease [Corynebacterium sp. HMSC078H07]
MPGPWEWAIIILIVVLLFGAKKLPELARSLGRSMRIFKSEVKEMKDENNTTNEQGQIATSKKNDEDFWNSPEMQPRSTKPVDGTQD